MNELTNTRPIPPLPGGGSWRFDDSAGQWISNDPAPQPEAAPSAEQPSAPEQPTDEA